MKVIYKKKRKYSFPSLYLFFLSLESILLTFENLSTFEVLVILDNVVFNWFPLDNSFSVQITNTGAH